jgi:hypothetical protein
MTTLFVVVQKAMALDDLERGAGAFLLVSKRPL